MNRRVVLRRVFTCGFLLYISGAQADITVTGVVTVDDQAGSTPLQSSGGDQIFDPGSVMNFFGSTVIVDAGTTLGGDDAVLGQDPGAASNLTLDGGVLDFIGNFFVGGAGQGNLDASNGSIINVDNFVYDNPNASLLSIDNSTLNVTTTIFLQDSLAEFTGGSTVTADIAVLGTIPGDQVFVDFDGVGTSLTTNGLAIGFGSLDVLAGAQVQSNGEVIIGNETDQSASLTVSGAGSFFGTTARVSMGTGFNADPTLNAISQFQVLDGATAQVDDIIRASTGAPGLATIRVEGAGSTLNGLSDIFVGFGGQANMFVNAGGTLNAQSGLFIAVVENGSGFLSSSGGIVNVTSTTSVGGIGGDGFIILDQGAQFNGSIFFVGTNDPAQPATQGVGSLQVNSGAALTGGSMLAGFGPNGVGSVSVDGAGSSIQLDVFDYGVDLGDGTLTISDTGSVVVAEEVNAGFGGTSFTSIDNGTLQTPTFDVGFDSPDNAAGPSFVSLNNGVIQADVTLSDQVFFSGSGQIVGNVVSDADLSPGDLDNPLGTIIVDGNFTQQTGSMFFEVAGTAPGEFDQLFVTGDLDVQAGTIGLDFINGFTPVGGESFPVLAAQGAANVAQTVQFNVGTGDTAFEFTLAPGVTIDPRTQQQVNATVGSVNLLNVNVADIAVLGSSNVSSLATNIDNTCVLNAALQDPNAAQQDLTQVCQQIRNAGNTPEQLTQILTAVDTQETTQTTNSLLLFTVPQHGNMSQRINGIRAGSSPFDFASLNLQFGNHQIAGADIERFVKKLLGGAAGEDDFARFGMFGNGNLNFGDKSATRQGSGFEYETVNLTIGADYRLRDDLILGGSVSYSDVNADFDEGGGMNVKSWSASFFASYFAGDKYYVDLLTTYGQNDLDVSRHIVFDSAVGGLNRRANSETDGDQYSISLGAGYDFTPGKWTFGPHGGLNFTEMQTDPYTEEGAGGLNLTVERQNATSFTANLGFHASYVFTPSWGVITPYIQADVVREFDTNAEVINIRFAADQFGNDPSSAPAPIRVETDDRDKWFTVVSAGFSAQLVNGVSGFLAYRNTLGLQDIALEDVTWGVRFERHF